VPNPPVKQSWLNRVKETQHFHAEQLRENPDWRLQDTALLLQRSIGSISQDLLLASWLKTHEKEILRFRRMKDAIEFVRQKQHQMKFDVAS